MANEKALEEQENQIILTESPIDYLWKICNKIRKKEIPTLHQLAHLPGKQFIKCCDNEDDFIEHLHSSFELDDNTLTSYKIKYQDTFPLPLLFINGARQSFRQCSNITIDFDSPLTNYSIPIYTQMYFWGDNVQDGDLDEAWGYIKFAGYLARTAAMADCICEKYFKNTAEYTIITGYFAESTYHRDVFVQHEKPQYRIITGKFYYK